MFFHQRPSTPIRQPPAEQGLFLAPGQIAHWAVAGHRTLWRSPIKLPFKNEYHRPVIHFPSKLLVRDDPRFFCIETRTGHSLHNLQRKWLASGLHTFQPMTMCLATQGVKCKGSYTKHAKQKREGLKGCGNFAVVKTTFEKVCQAQGVTQNPRIEKPFQRNNQLKDHPKSLPSTQKLGFADLLLIPGKN